MGLLDPVKRVFTIQSECNLPIFTAHGKKKDFACQNKNFKFSSSLRAQISLKSGKNDISKNIFNRYRRSLYINNVNFPESIWNA